MSDILQITYEILVEELSSEIGQDDIKRSVEADWSPADKETWTIEIPNDSMEKEAPS